MVRGTTPKSPDFGLARLVKSDSGRLVPDFLLGRLVHPHTVAWLVVVAVGVDTENAQTTYFIDIHELDRRTFHDGLRALIWQFWLGNLLVEWMRCFWMHQVYPSPDGSMGSHSAPTPGRFRRWTECFEDIWGWWTPIDLHILQKACEEENYQEYLKDLS